VAFLVSLSQSTILHKNKTDNMRYIILTLIGLSMAVLAQAQRPDGKAPKIGTLSGTVVDSASNKALEFATVSVFRLRDSALVGGMITDAKGQFKIEQLPVGKHYVTVSFMGYNTYTIPSLQLTFQAPSQNLGQISIAPNRAVLETLEVTAERSDFQLGLDKRVFNVDKTNLADSENATEILRNTPTVEVDFDGAVKVRGSAVQVYINGKPTGLTGDSQAEILDQLPANSVKKIELITSPSAKYDPEGASGIINIVLKKNVLEGFTGTVNASVGTPLQSPFQTSPSNASATTPTWLPFRRYRGGLSLNFRNEKVNFFSNFSYNNNRRYSSSYNYRESTGIDTSSALQQYNNRTNWGTGGMARVGMDYYFDDNNTLTLAARLRPSTGDGAGSIQYDYYDENSTKTNIEERLNDKEEDRFSMTYNLIYSKVFVPKKKKGTEEEGVVNRRDNSKDNGGRRRWYGGGDGRAGGGRGTMGDKQELVIDLQYAHNNRNEVENFEQQIYAADWTPSNNTPILQETQNRRGMHQGTVMLDYTHPLPKEKKFEAGYKGNIRWMGNDFASQSFDYAQDQFTNDAGLTNNFEFTEQVHAAYVTFAHKIKKFQYKLGFRAEYTLAESRLVEPDLEVFVNNYPSFFPTLNLSYELGKSQQMQLSFSRRINRPSSWALNPFPSYSDPLNLRFGNPFLLPQYSNNVELSYAKYWKKGHTLMLTGFYRYNTDLMDRLRTLRPDGVAVQTFFNFSTSQLWGGELVLRVSPAKWVNFNVSGSLYQNIQDGSNINDNFSVNTLEGNGSAGVNFTLDFGMRIAAYAWVSAPKYVPQGWVSGYAWSSISVSQKVLKDKGRFTLSVQNPFFGARFAYETQANSFYQAGNSRWESPVVELRFSYRFGSVNVRDARSKNASRLRNGGGDEDSGQGPG
jgi:outer membrane receptor protein involved in Fe transport